MARFNEAVCRTSILLLCLLSLGSTLPIIERQTGGHGSSDAFYQRVQAAGKTIRDHVPVEHIIHPKQDHLNFTASAPVQDNISKKLSDLQARFEELSDQNEDMRRRLDEQVVLNKNTDALVGKLRRILGEGYVGDTKLTDGSREEFGNDDDHMKEQLNELSEYLGNREADLVTKVRNQVPSSSIQFLVNQLRKDSSLNGTDQAVINFIARFLVQLSDPSNSKTRDSKTQVSPGALNKIEFHNGSANVIEELELIPAKASRVESAFHSNNTDRVSASRKIAFSVAATVPQFGIAGEAQAVQFQDIIENKGEGFLASNHTFVCSVPGWYYFTFSLRTVDGKYLSVLLMKNADYVVGVYTDKDEQRNTMETQSTVISLMAGDAVWLRLPPSEDYGIFSDRYRYSTFTGFLLFKE